MLKVNRKPNIHARTSYCLAQIIASRKAVPSASDRKSIRSAEGIRSAQLWSTEGATFADRLILLEPRYCVTLYPANCGPLLSELTPTSKINAVLKPTSFLIQRRLIMPLLEIPQARRFVSAMIRIEDATAQRIDQYAAFSKASADEVIDKAVAYVFAKDKDFQEFLESPQAAQVPQSLRIRQPGQNSSAPESASRSGKATKSSQVPA